MIVTAARPNTVRLLRRIQHHSAYLQGFGKTRPRVELKTNRSTEANAGHALVNDWDELSNW